MTPAASTISEQGGPGTVAGGSSFPDGCAAPLVKDVVQLDVMGGWVPGPVRLVLEAPVYLRSTVPMEFMVAVRQVLDLDRGLVLRGGIGHGITQSISTPTWRLVLGIGFERAEEPDLDLDGIVNRKDACPDRAEAPSYRAADLTVTIPDARDHLVKATLVLRTGSLASKVTPTPAQTTPSTST